MGETYESLNLMLDLCVIGILLLGIRLFRRPRTAKWGNLTAAFALVLGACLVCYRNGLSHPYLVATLFVAGAGAGYWVAKQITMIQIPAMVAFQNGAGGAASFCLSFAVLMRGGSLGMINAVSGILGLAIGAVTFSGSMVACGKLSNKLVPNRGFSPHPRIVMVNFASIAVPMVAALYVPAGGRMVCYLAIIVLSILLGVFFSIRIGGADMPVLISFLNAMTGMAAAFCGMIIENKLLIACGAMVGASGLILTHAMCRAMNRNLFRIFVPVAAMAAKGQGEERGDRRIRLAGDGPKTLQGINQRFARADASPDRGIEIVPEGDPIPNPVPDLVDPKNNLDKALDALIRSEKIIIIPGYGMALAQAQFKVVELASMLEGMGKEVKFAIHPVAGRMPGHMNVLLAEADVDYDRLFEMDEINLEFSQTDVALVFGACDVVNPTAMAVEGTPISGMPILMVQDAGQIIVCNFDEKPGYSGVENSLYHNAKTLMLRGDAAATACDLINGIHSLVF